MFKRFYAGFAAGYVLGARAGEKRYEQMSDLAGRAMELPVVKQLSGRASELFTSDNSKQIVHSVMERAKAGFSPSERPARRGSSSTDDVDDVDDDFREEAEDQDDSEPYDTDDEDWDDEDQGDDEQDEDRDDDAPPPSRNGSGRKPRGDEARGQRGAIRSLAAAARERGRVD